MRLLISFKFHVKCSHKNYSIVTRFPQGLQKKMLCIIYIYIKKEQTQKLYKIMHFLHIFKRVLGADSRRKKYDNTFSI